MKNDLIKIPEDVWENAYTYENYFSLLEQLAWQGKTTGPDQSEARVKNAPLNIQRMKRIYRTHLPNAEHVAYIKENFPGVRFLIIAEGWCGDAAQVTPAIGRILEMAGKEYRFILRDTHPEIMDLFLTNGTRSIPVVFAINESGEVLGTHWGPRPKAIQTMVNDWKIQMSRHDWHHLLHTWYAKDRGETLEADFIAWLKLGSV